jgi:zinc protease
MSLRTLSSAAERDKALDIMARVLQRPLFPEAMLAREKARLIASLKEAETKPESIADKAFGKAVFGAHPYALPVSARSPAWKKSPCRTYLASIARITGPAAR